MIQIFGYFIEELHGEYLKIVSFMPTPLIPRNQRWKVNGLSANFIADYVQIFSVYLPPASGDMNVPIPILSKNAIKYITNEILENAMKFSDAQQAIQMTFHLHGNQMIFQTIHSTNPQNTENFKKFIHTLLNEEPENLYIRQMESHAAAVDGTYSGLGLLSLICDYSAKLGWKFETFEQSPSTLITTMVSLPYSGS